MASDRPMAMIPRREITTGPESFRSSASSVRTGRGRPPAMEGAWAFWGSMGAAPGFQRGGDTGAAVKKGQAKLRRAAEATPRRGAKGTGLSAPAARELPDSHV